jgi:sulfite exporter TauE/SafE
VGLGALGIALGLAMGGLEWIEGVRGQLAGWLLIAFGLAYTAWGIRRAIRRLPHSHWHTHEDGLAHAHAHRHAGAHVHAHDEVAPGARRASSLTPWVLFTIFVFGPCEPLIPLLMYPAAEGSWWGVALVSGVFGVLTVTTMLAAVWVGYLGLSRLSFGNLERYSHALAGLAVLACGAAIQLGF